MDLSTSLENRQLRRILNDLNDEIWDLVHAGQINNQDDFYDAFHTHIDNQVIYTYDCEKILENNSEYHYLEHDVYGRPENIAQAAYACIYDYLMDHADTITFADIENALEE